MSFFSELQRRSVFRVAASYVVVSWLLLQIVDVIDEPLVLPAWFGTVVVVLLAIGFPVALLFAWAFELTPDGIKLTQAQGAGRDASGSRLDYLLVGGLAVVAAVTLWGRLPLSSVGDSVAPGAVQDQSIAVLPFADMSPQGDQEYFGDGIAEELLNELTRLDGLRVAGRTSSFSFKQSEEDLRTIGESLNVSAILEGSVRKDGDRIRITAQLINAADGYHLWSETYDRELTDIFAIQEEISASVAGALGVRLGVGGVNSFKGAGTQNVEAYEAYLEGLSRVRTEGQSIPFFERATELDPNYAAAWSQLALRTAGLQWISLPEEAPEILDRAYRFVQRAVELNPASAQSMSLLGTIRYARNDWVGAEEAHTEALSLLSNRQTLTQYGNLLMRSGRTTAARMQLGAAQAVEPLGGRPTLRSWQVSLAQGRFTEAREMAEWFAGPEAIANRLSIALNEGDAEEVRATLAMMPSTAIYTSALYAPVLREFDSPENALATLREIYADDTLRWPSKLHDIALLAAYLGTPELALQAIGEEVRSTNVRLQTIWYPLMSEVRQLPGFKELVTDLNLVAYWRAYGWADACRPLGEDDFTCT